METNGIIVPDEGTTTQYIADTVGGWVYEVTTTVQVSQHNLEAVKDNLDQARTTLATAQAAVDALEPVAVSFEAAVSAEMKPVEMQLDTATVEEATSTSAVPQK